MTKLTVDLKEGEALTIGNATVRLERKSGRVARLVVDAPQETPIETPKARQARMSALHTNPGANHG